MGHRDEAAQAARAQRHPDVARITELTNKEKRTAAEQRELDRLVRERLESKKGGS